MNRLDERWDESLGGITSSAFYGLAAQGFDHHGLRTLRLRPLLFFQRRTTATALAYLNHPPFPHLVTAPAYRHLGRDERAMRIPILGLAIMVLAATFVAARRVGGLDLAFFTTGLLAATPLFCQYGNLVDAPMFSLATLVPAWLAWESYRKHRTRRALVVWIIAGGLSGASYWFGYFLVPVLWMDLLIREGKRGLLRLGFVAGLPFGLALVAYLAWLALATDGWSDMATQLRVLLSAPVGGDSKLTPEQIDYFRNMQAHLWRGWGWPFLGLIAIGSVVALFQRGPASRTAAILCIAGLLPCIAFRSRAAFHEFWILQATPGLALLAALPILLAWRHFRERPQRWAVLAGWVAVMAWGLWTGKELHASYLTDKYTNPGLVLNRYVGPDDVVLYPMNNISWRFYCQAATVPLYDSADAHRRYMEALRPGRDQINRLFVFWTPEAGVVPELAPVLSLVKSRQVVPYRGTTAPLFELDIDGAMKLFRN
ncbi:MAG: hypothetical protein KDB53_17745 [Planctomycetes bacterium]|nr:hypothetical protein [Planctomycetota bacterium]